MTNRSYSYGIMPAPVSENYTYDDLDRLEDNTDNADSLLNDDATFSDLSTPPDAYGHISQKNKAGTYNYIDSTITAKDAVNNITGVVGSEISIED